ncbi:hypothetical protein AAIH46_18060 [Rhizobium sp. 0TCS1.26]|uniref:hypothetical protein n=1 Tax=Rhizobium sp. 0TCS1.26 TaxID=3142623 RepID=UPI003D2735D4
MEQIPPVKIALSNQARARLNRIASDMGRTPDDLASAIVDQWTAVIARNLINRHHRPAGPDRPDFTHMGIIAPPEEDVP